MSLYRQAKESILTAYQNTLWQPFLAAIERYRLIQDGDRIAVCISGGKDSMLMATLFKMLKEVSTIAFEVQYLVMDPGYNPANRRKIEQNAALLEIPITVFESNIFAVANRTEKSPCYLCARMRRGHLYAYAQSLGCNKIALGHHFSDVIETTLLGMFYGSQLQAMLPKLHAANFDGMALIRPLYCVHEEDIIDWSRANGLAFIRCACRFTENQTVDDSGESTSKRQEVKEFLRRIRQALPDAEQSVFDAIHRIDADTFPLYKSGGEEHFFLDKKQGSDLR